MRRVRMTARGLAVAGDCAALFNLNPLMERDGYHVLVDLLKEPGLRRRATRHLHEVLSKSAPQSSRPATTHGGCSCMRSRRSCGRS